MTNLCNKCFHRWCGIRMTDDAIGQRFRHIQRNGNQTGVYVFPTLEIQKHSLMNQHLIESGK